MVTSLKTRVKEKGGHSTHLRTRHIRTGQGQPTLVL